MKTIEERAASTAQWILRREGLLKAANIKQLIQEELEKQHQSDMEKARRWLASNSDKYARSSLTDIPRYLWVDGHMIEDFLNAMEEE